MSVTTRSPSLVTSAYRKAVPTDNNPAIPIAAKKYRSKMSVLPELKVSTTLRTARGKINETTAVNVRARKAIEIINLYGFKHGQSSFKAEIRFDLLRSRGSASASFVIAII